MLFKIKILFERIKHDLLDIFNKVFIFVKSTEFKFQNLYKTNYDNGMHHLNVGNVWDATFRFKIIQKFWPEKLEAQCKYALCLILENMDSDANNLLHDILKKDPDLEEAKILLSRIERGENLQIINEYNEKIKINKSQSENNSNILKTISISGND